MPTYELRNRRAKLIAAEVSADDLASACEIAAEHIGVTTRELLDRMPREYEMVEVGDVNVRIPVPPRRWLFRDRTKETVH